MDFNSLELEELLTTPERRPLGVTARQSEGCGVFVHFFHTNGQYVIVTTIASDNDVLDQRAIVLSADSSLHLAHELSEADKQAVVYNCGADCAADLESKYGLSGSVRHGFALALLMHDMEQAAIVSEIIDEELPEPEATGCPCCGVRLATPGEEASYLSLV